ncbi:hypothetical protein MtrunA17_Chr4g0046541 [Medicago truncatula]|uniref:Transmembrane protein n=1 Tax=Medicago truncatula TaxID=3880 RepID=A0A396IHK0_MEDTR|nr:hypothetical protein MtrunA17_Chr4g0046541 [Medicago truncatula]
MPILVFSAIAMFDDNVVNCFLPPPSHEMHEFLTALPVGIGVLCSMLFVAFPPLIDVELVSHFQQINSYL